VGKETESPIESGRVECVEKSNCGFQSQQNGEEVVSRAVGGGEVRLENDVGPVLLDKGVSLAAKEVVPTFLNQGGLKNSQFNVCNSHVTHSSSIRLMIGGTKTDFPDQVQRGMHVQAEKVLEASQLLIIQHELGINHSLEDGQTTKRIVDSKVIDVGKLTRARVVRDQ